jgi:hypothetical protein
MMKILASASIVVTVLFLSTGALAGAKSFSPVKLGDGFIYGCLGSVRNSSDNMQFIFCEDSGNSALVYARNSVGIARGCHTTNPTHLAVIRGMDDSSCIYARYNRGGQCTYIRVTNSSVAEPKE